MFQNGYFYVAVHLVMVFTYEPDGDITVYVLTCETVPKMCTIPLLLNRYCSIYSRMVFIT